MVIARFEKIKAVVKLQGNVDRNNAGAAGSEVVFTEIPDNAGRKCADLKFLCEQEERATGIEPAFCLWAIPLGRFASSIHLLTPTIETNYGNVTFFTNFTKGDHNAEEPNTRFAQPSA